MRLTRDQLGDDVYRRENTAFRDAGRRLAGARHSQVLLETLDALSERYPGEAPPARFVRLKRTLARRHAAAQRRLRDGTAVAEVLSELRRARARVPAWPLEREALNALAPGLKRIYRRGRRAYRSARREPSSENPHELRNRVKDLWYAAQIVRRASPKRMKRLARDAHELSELIGEDHDLAILGERASERRDRVDDERTIGELGALSAAETSSSGKRCGSERGSFGRSRARSSGSWRTRASPPSRLRVRRSALCQLLRRDEVREPSAPGAELAPAARD